MQHADVKLLTILERVDPKPSGVEQLLALAAVLAAGLIVLVATVVAALGLVGLSAAHADMCNNGAVKPGGGSGDWYQCQGGAWQYYPPPTFDPNSGDGIGPNPPMPAACIRFHQPCPQ